MGRARSLDDAPAYDFRCNSLGASWSRAGTGSPTTLKKSPSTSSTSIAPSSWIA